MFFEKMQNRKNDGFTLVELIVVIAILAILAGIGVPAYSGYVEKANIAADQQLVSEVMNALTLQYYAREGWEGTAVVVLTPSGASAESEFAKAAMDATFGTDAWQTTAKLKYNKWGKGAAVSQSVLGHFSSVIDGSNTTSDPLLADVYNGTYAPTFANDVDALFNLMESTAVGVGEKLETTGALLLKDAASKTTGIDADDFAVYWAGQEWDNSFFMGDNTQYDGNAGILEGTQLENAVANAAVLKARNTAFAGYLRDNGVDNPDVYNYIANYNYGNTVVPKDAVGAFDTSSADYENFEAGLLKILGTQEAVDSVLDIGDTYFTTDESGTMPAMRDGLAYFAMMDTILNVNQSSTDDASYWNEMQGAVSMYGSIARGEATVEELQEAYAALPKGSENAVVVALMGQKHVVAVQSSPNVISR